MKYREFATSGMVNEVHENQAPGSGLTWACTRTTDFCILYPRIYYEGQLVADTVAGYQELHICFNCLVMEATGPEQITIEWSLPQSTNLPLDLFSKCHELYTLYPCFNV